CHDFFSGDSPNSSILFATAALVSVGLFSKSLPLILCSFFFPWVYSYHC
ncbi:unnamed protein product, partial [Arabidopsis halleri]